MAYGVFWGSIWVAFREGKSFDTLRSCTHMGVFYTIKINSDLRIYDYSLISDLSNAFYLNPKQVALGGFCQLDPPKLLLIAEKQLAFLAKAKVGHATRYDDSSNETPSRIPYLDTVTTASVYVSVNIALNTIRNTNSSKRKRPAIDQKRGTIFTLNIKRVNRSRSVPH